MTKLTATAYDILDTINEAIFILDFDRIIDCNSAALKLFDLSKEELLLNTIATLSPDKQPMGLSSLELFKFSLKKAYSGNEQRLEWNFLKNNELIYANVIIKRTIIENKLFAILIIHNITECVNRDKANQDKIQTLIKERNSCYQIIQSLPSYIFSIDKSGKILMMNKSLMNALQIDDNTIKKGCYFSDFVPDAFLDATQQWINANFNLPYFVAFESTLLTKNASILHIQWQGKHIAQEHNSKYMTIFGSNISSIKGLEQAYLESEKRFQNLSNLLPITIFETNTNFDITYINQTGFDKFGFSDEEFMLGLKIGDLVKESDKNRIINDLQICFSNQIVENKEYSFINQNGNEISYIASASPIVIDDVVFGLRGVIIDITERKRAELEIIELNENLELKVKQRTAELNEALERIEESNIELRQLNESIAEEAHKLLQLNEKLLESESELKLANQTKDKFFSIIAHDLKNPFAAILGLSNFLVKEIDELSTEEIKEFSNNIWESADSLYKLLENLLEWSRMKRGVTSFNPEEICITLALEMNLKIINEFAKQKNIQLINTIPSGVQVEADMQMLNTVLRNLISNAVKFTPINGTIEIGTNIDYSSDFTAIYVKDSGIGMDSVLISKLFKIDEKVSRPGTNDEPSTGLGLLLCKEFVERHGGQIWVESEVGKGSTFYFTLPKS